VLGCFDPRKVDLNAAAERIRGIAGVTEVIVNPFFGLTVVALPGAIRNIISEEEARSVAVSRKIEPFLNMAKVG